jgi:hypothetical protein
MEESILKLPLIIIKAHHLLENTPLVNGSNTGKNNLETVRHVIPIEGHLVIRDA